MSGTVFHDSELMASMARKLQELEQQLKAQNEEMLSKVGPGQGTAREDIPLIDGKLCPRNNLGPHELSRRQRLECGLGRASRLPSRGGELGCAFLK